MSSASPASVLQPRATQLCRIVLGVRLIASVLAVLVLASNVLSWRFAVAFAFAVVSSALAYVFSRTVIEVLQRHPILLGLDTFVALIVLTLGGQAAPFVIFTVTTSAIAGLLYRWGGMLYIVVLQVTCYSVAVLTEATPGIATVQTLLAPALYYPLVGFAGVWMRRMLDEADRADEARKAVEVSAATDRERTRLAGEMHDSLAKTVRGIAFSAASLPSWIRRDPERAASEARKIAAAAEVASREARSLLTDLRAGHVDQALVPAVGQACTAWSERTGVCVSLEGAAEVDLPLGPRYEAVNVLKEALSNIERHAQASHVVVRVVGGAAGTRLTVRDDGVGFDTSESGTFTETGHYGLVGMTERAHRAGGELTVTSSVGDGSTVELALPGPTRPEGEAVAIDALNEIPAEAR